MSASVLTGGILCYVTGLAGYLAFRGATQGDILDNFSGPVAAFFKILVVVHLVFYIPNEMTDQTEGNVDQYLLSGVCSELGDNSSIRSLFFGGRDE